MFWGVQIFFLILLIIFIKKQNKKKGFNLIIYLFLYNKNDK